VKAKRVFDCGQWCKLRWTAHVLRVVGEVVVAGRLVTSSCHGEGGRGVLCVLCFEKLFFWKSALKHPEIAIHEHSAWLEGPTRCLIKKLSDINSIKQNQNQQRCLIKL